MSAQKLSQEHQEIIGKADLYERDKVPLMFRPLALCFLKQISLRPGEDVLDVACGTGIIARIVAERLGSESRIVGTDINPKMLEVARAHTPNGISIEWYEADAQDLSIFVDNSFDLVLCQQGFQYFPDKVRALQEMHRVMVPGGKIALCIARAVNPENQPYQWAKSEALRKFVSAEAGEKQRTLVPFFDGGKETLRSLMTETGFYDIQINNMVNTINKGFPEDFVTEEDYLELDEETRDFVVTDIRKVMEAYRTVEGSAVPYGFHIAISKK